MAKQKFATKETLVENGKPVGVKFTWISGAVMELRFDDLAEDMRLEAMAHGLKQKIGDSYSGAGSMAEAIASAQATLETIRDDGTWNKKARNGIGGILVDALVRITGKTAEEVRQALAEKTEDEVKALRKQPQVDHAIKVIQAERSAAKADTAGDVTDLL